MQQPSKIASYITIVLFISTVVSYILNYTKIIVKKQDLIILEKKVNDISSQYENLLSIYKIRNFQERVWALEDKYPEKENMPKAIKDEIRFLNAELDILNERYIK
jgi:hypothetical protein